MASAASPSSPAPVSDDLLLLADAAEASEQPNDGGSNGPEPQPPPPPPPPPPLLPFRPRVLTVGRGPGAQQRQERPHLPLPLPVSKKQRPAPAAPAPAPAPAPTPTGSSASSLWRRHHHGSYQHYYFRRKPWAGGGAGGGGRDARLALLKEDWFRGRAFLDIGTNTGKVAWEIYQAFGPARVLGVDIDPELIAVAQTKLAHACRRDGVDHGAAVRFECRDFVGGVEEEEKEGEQQEQEEQYDVITCLSVTKHIHLQGGDAALLRLFHRVFRRLRPGGRFILEPQPWRTYRKRKHASAESARHYSSIKLRPPFSEVLVGEVGFAGVEALGVPPDAAAGYERPLFCFWKDGGSAGGEGDRRGTGQAAAAVAASRVD